MPFAFYWEWFGVVTALVYVILAALGKRICFVFGLISSVVFVEICFGDRLYFDTGINLYYVVMSVVGWITWNNKGKDVNPRKFAKNKFVFLLIGAILLSLILGFITDRYTDASMPYMDSFTTIMAVLATWMLVEKYVENWIIWIVADSVSIYMYWVKDHSPIALLFCVYTVIAIFGLINWNRKMNVIQ